MKWLTHDVLLISLSAFFADAGYQALIAGFPLFLVIYLHAPAYYLGIVMAFAYGIGSLFAYIGGKLADRLGKKAVALFGNLLITILSFTGFAGSALSAGAIFSTGWWFRNFRTPARRAMLGDITKKLDKGKVFGFLNALDIGGGLVAITYLSFGIFLHIPFSLLFLVTIVPILISSLCLALVHYKGLPAIKPSSKLNSANALLASRIAKRSSAAASARSGTVNAAKHGAPLSASTTASANVLFVSRASSRSYYAVLIATALFGLSFYSFSFPVLTVAQQSNSVLGASSYFVFLIFSALFGYILGSRIKDMLSGLALLGYMLAGIGSLVLGLAFSMHANVLVSYFAIALMGIGAGAIETFEPAIISMLRKKSASGSGMGMLTSSRSIGLFFSNLAVGFLYMIGPLFAYSFSAVLAVAAGFVLLWARR